MGKNASVVIVAPNSFERFIGQSWENQFQIITNSGHLASLTNLDACFNSKDRAPRMDKGWKSTNPLAGYYLESFLKLRGFEAISVFEWENDDKLIDAMKSDPIAIALSTTYITDNNMLADCVQSMRRIVGNTPIIVGGPYIWKHKRQLLQDAQTEISGELRERAMQEFGVDLLGDSLFGPHVPPILRDALYVGHEFGEYTLLSVLNALQNGLHEYKDFGHVPNLILPLKDGTWHATKEQAEPVDLSRDYTRWDLIDVMPGMVPIRTSVGCPYKCRYCDFIELHPKVIKRSPNSMIEEIRAAKARGRSFFNFIDDNIFLTKSRINDLTVTIRDQEIDMIWGGFFRVDRVDESNITAIYESGCRFGMCGIESGDDEQLTRMQKGCNREEIFNGIELSTAAGIKLVLTYIVGYPGETQSSIDNTIEFINGLTTVNQGYSSYQVYPFYLLPNTAVDEVDYRKEFNLRGRHGNWSHSTMDAEEARGLWAPYMFQQIKTLPYDYYATDCPFDWTVERRNTAFELRRTLTNTFLAGRDDEAIQEDFAELWSLIKVDSASTIPDWRDVLAPRRFQPGERKPKVRLGSS